MHEPQWCNYVQGQTATQRLENRLDGHLVIRRKTMINHANVRKLYLISVATTNLCASLCLERLACVAEPEMTSVSCEWHRTSKYPNWYANYIDSVRLEEHVHYSNTSNHWRISRRTIEESEFPKRFRCEENVCSLFCGVAFAFLLRLVSYMRAGRASSARWKLNWKWNRNCENRTIWKLNNLKFKIDFEIDKLREIAAFFSILNYFLENPNKFH